MNYFCFRKNSKTLKNKQKFDKFRKKFIQKKSVSRIILFEFLKKEILLRILTKSLLIIKKFFLVFFF